LLATTCVIARFFAPALRAGPGAILVTRARAFEAAHAYRGAAFGRDRRVHGHNYVATATVAGDADPRTDVLADLRAIDPVLRAVTDPLDHRRLDVEYAPLGGREPGVESLAVAIFGELEAALSRALPRARLASLRVAETEDLWADHAGGEHVELTRAYGFSAAHRLSRPDRSDAENRALYGKCANPHPHGHDYRVEVTVAGAPDRDTGLIVDLAALDRCVEDRVVSHFDHRYLNAEVPPFERVAPTGERIAERIWELLADVTPGLARVTVYETPRSAFTYRGPG
jgi:6-pyruvoyltetrahydropterin/6-carboxytetrahydropterin synthase